jgi:hypothetical protein
MLWHKTHHTGKLAQLNAAPDAQRGDIRHRVRTDFGES